jgi:hypothetical protein
MQIPFLHQSCSQPAGIQQLKKIMTELPCFTQTHALVLSGFANSKFQEALKHVTAQVNSSFIPAIAMKAPGIFPPFLGCLPETIS